LFPLSESNNRSAQRKLKSRNVCYCAINCFICTSDRWRYRLSLCLSVRLGAWV